MHCGRGVRHSEIGYKISGWGWLHSESVLYLVGN